MCYEEISAPASQWLERANEEALQSVKNGGGPFGAVIVQADNETGEVIRHWVSHNQVVLSHDPTAHAEVMVIRMAAKELGVVDLGCIYQGQAKLSQSSEQSYCVMYSSAEPCPMCISAIYWAGIKKLMFSATRFDAAKPGVDFSDAVIYEELARPYHQRRYMQVEYAKTANHLDAFDYYKNNTGVKRYGKKPA
ncbi:Guanine deaminase [Piscirickettsia salmonis]|uniref:Guanine deaminase n=1 Tax=Piscirickettsia salmonis TaxID=1238 RepID=A0A1L6TBZ3_PISSA|nr:nucleoside deaminase [Piscirickettsia salmonis]AKP74019.1 guanine deaminase [Piscirickettsia salmonis LF-89 = ATCC VR-1361]ALB22867.1 guanine deaminase [Piscirickettsia salmonis]ALY02840.1 guanine deaminase [Piscirickettsia salmonis]AMA42395.1 guanine deaminase [Piscirickettsia salmonis]AOS34865.1 guanine deaminase [Piscirickettsia salmonis]